MEGSLVNSQVQRQPADEFYTALQVQRDGTALRGSKRLVAQEDADSRRGLPPAAGCTALGAGRARQPRTRNQTSSGVWPQSPRTKSGRWDAGRWSRARE